MCPSGRQTGDVLDDVAGLVAERNRLDARLARAVRSAELAQAPERDGQKSMASWLLVHAGTADSDRDMDETLAGIAGRPGVA